MDVQAVFHIGERIVYPLHGMVRVDALCIRVVNAQPQSYYQLVLEKEPKGVVLVPVASAQAMGLRHILQASQAPEVFRQVQQPCVQPPLPRQALKQYEWCKGRLRQGDVFGLAEVWRFLYDLAQVETITSHKLKHLRDYVGMQLSSEMASALQCTCTLALNLLTTALTSKYPVVLPSPCGCE